MALTFPYHYDVRATAVPDGEAVLTAERLPALPTAPPTEFGGPGDRWSPETLLVGAVVDCFVFTFRAVARAAGLSWQALECRADGTLDRIDRVAQFTSFRIHASLRVPQSTDAAAARRVLARAKELCIVSNSLKAACAFEADVEASNSTEAA